MPVDLTEWHRELAQLSGSPDRDLVANSLLKCLDAMTDPSVLKYFFDNLFDILPAFLDVARRADDATQCLILQAVERTLRDENETPKETFLCLATLAADIEKNYDIDDYSASPLHLWTVRELCRSAARIHRSQRAFLEDGLRAAEWWFRRRVAEDHEAAVHGWVGIVRCMIEERLEVGIESGEQPRQCTGIGGGDDAPHDISKGMHKELLLRRRCLWAAGELILSRSMLDMAQMRFEEDMKTFNKLARDKISNFEGTVLEILRYPHRILAVFEPTDALDDLDATLDGDPVENLGYACMLCRRWMAADRKSDGGGSEKSSRAAAPLDVKSELRMVDRILRCFTEAAGETLSVPLNIVPLWIACVAARKWGKAKCGQPSWISVDDISHIEPIMQSLIDAMSYHPVELIRSCAHDGLNRVWDAMDPHARFRILEMLANHLQASQSTSLCITPAAAAVSLQRLRQEMASCSHHDNASEESDSAPFTRKAVLRVALPWICQDQQPPGWSEAVNVVEHADVMSAALSILRLLVSQELRKYASSEVNSCQIERCMANNATKQFQLFGCDLDALIRNDLRPLCNLLDRVITIQTALTDALDDEKRREFCVPWEVLMATMRLQEVSEAVLSSAQSLVSHHASMFPTP